MTTNPPPPPLPSPTGVASLAERRENAKSVKLKTSLLGVGPGDELDQAHRKLDKLSDRARPPKAENDQDEKEADSKILWQFAGTDYSAVFAKADKKERINYIVGLLRPGKEVGFEKIGEVKKAPIRSDNFIAWDVIRPNRPHIRVVAKGNGGKADNITIFLVQRSGPPSDASRL